MKRQRLLRYLREHGCEIFAEGRRHTRVRNLANGQTSVVSRSREIRAVVVQDICKQLGVPAPSEK